MAEEKASVLEKSLSAILDRAMQGIETGVDFLSAELPEVIEQMLTWRIVESLIKFSIATIVLLICVLVPVIKWGTLYEKLVKIEQKPVFVIPLFYIIFLSIFVASMFNLQWLKILIAPKLYLIEYAAELIK